ncbi:hypothetical protein VTN77DRAFT_8633 [Rasamsonia byssochlamydoides]|uniref:uncharacterized protein n=1 Tax=Rasamsonia byssochlamydoides TaxID=89139 RepID=UPI0037448C82
MDFSQIRDVYSMVHLIFHRNKNQHGKSKWWKWLSMLRRSVLKLLLAETGQKEKTSLAGYLHANLIPRCYIAFSTVVADGQFSTLGTVLLAVLARLAKAIGFKETPSSLTERKMETNSNNRVDTGEPVCREDEESEFPIEPKPQRTSHADSQGKESSLEFTVADEVMPTTSSKSSKKKRRHKTNVIDDLFNTLV